MMSLVPIDKMNPKAFSKPEYLNVVSTTG